MQTYNVIWFLDCALYIVLPPPECAAYLFDLPCPTCYRDFPFCHILILCILSLMLLLC
jgi:hypothetical protein